MQLSRRLVWTRTIGLTGLTGLIVLALPAIAAPLPRDAAGGDPRSERRLSEADLVLSDPRLDLPDVGTTGIQGQLSVPQGGRSLGSDSPTFDFGRVAQPSGGSMQESLRGYVTVRRGNSSGPAGPQQARGGYRPPDDSLGLDLGLSSNEWIRESVQGVMTSVLSLNVNERGQASFSVLGLGDFSVIFSGDRSEIAFQAGEEVILSGRRTGHTEGAGGAHSGGNADGSPAYGPGAGAATPDAGESPLRRALALVMEIVSHPLSFILYGLIGAYFLVWSVLANRSRRPRKTRSSARHSSSGAHALAYARAAPAVAGAAVAAPAVKKARKRTRVRVRMRKYR